MILTWYIIDDKYGQNGGKPCKPKSCKIASEEEHGYCCTKVASGLSNCTGGVLRSQRDCVRKCCAKMSPFCHTRRSNYGQFLFYTRAIAKGRQLDDNHSSSKFQYFVLHPKAPPKADMVRKLSRSSGRWTWHMSKAWPNLATLARIPTMNSTWWSWCYSVCSNVPQSKLHSGWDANIHPTHLASHCLKACIASFSRPLATHRPIRNMPKKKAWTMPPCIPAVARLMPMQAQLILSSHWYEPAMAGIGAALCWALQLLPIGNAGNSFSFWSKTTWQFPWPLAPSCPQRPRSGSVGHWAQHGMWFQRQEATVPHCLYQIRATKSSTTQHAFIHLVSKAPVSAPLGTLLKPTNGFIPSSLEGLFFTRSPVEMKPFSAQ